MKVFFRRIFRLALLLPWLIYLGVISVPVTLRRDKWAAIAGMAKMTKYWGSGLLRIFNIRLHVTGDIDGYDGGLVVSNHMGYVDVFVHAAVFGLRFAPKIEMKSWPFIGFMTGLSRPVWIDRSSRQKSKISAEAMADTMRGGIPMIVYAEGTTTDGQHGLLPFKSTPFEAVAEAGLPILPILTFYDPVKGGKFSMAWSGSDKLLPHVWRVLGLKESRAEVFVLEQVTPLPGEDRKELARRVHDLMEREYWRIKNHG